MLVNFVIGGTQKGGTSALDSFLRQHPEICLPETKKELHYFDNEENFADRPNYKKYHTHFRPESRHRAIGEATPSYMYWTATPYRIWSYNPHVKWILVLRNPIERAFSAWNMETKRGAEHLSFEEAVAQEAVRCREALPLQHRVFSYVDRGFYAHQVRRLFNIFDEENCLILLTEDLRTDHHNTLRKVFQFLKVDRDFIPPEASVFEQDYDRELNPKLRSKLVDTFYFDIRELERLLRRDLSSWYGM
jgi:Sulfotransferase domain